MRVLFVVEPLVMHSRPFHYWAWLGYFARMLRAVEAAGGEGRLLTNEALAGRATAPESVTRAPAQATHGLPHEKVIALAQASIRALFARPNVDIVSGLHRGTLDPARVRAYGALVAERLGGFVPDVVVALTPAPHLAHAFPDALVLYAETAAYSRSPFPPSVFFDPAGMWDASLLGVHVDALAGVTLGREERDLLATLRARHGAYFSRTTPFHALEAELRARHERLALLPLQFGGEPGFDTNAPFRTQGELLLHVAEDVPPEIGLLVVEHPTAHWVGDVIDEETLAFVAARFPNVYFLDFRAAESAGQYLVHHVDFVISVSSSLGLQALLFGKGLVSVGASHLAALASVRGVEALTKEGAAPRTDLDAVLAWMVGRYFVPLDLATDPAWLTPFLSRTRERRRAGVPAPALLDPIAPAPARAALLTAALDRLAPLEAALTNGAFADWTSFVPAGWELVDLGATDASVERGEDGAGRPAVILARSFAGPEPTLFLQRVPDVTKTAGRLARVRFRARAGAPLALGLYLYGQLADGGPGLGADLRTVVVDEAWREHACVLRMPELGARTPGHGHHTEVVFALAPAAGAVELHLADVHLEPVPV